MLPPLRLVFALFVCLLEDSLEFRLPVEDDLEFPILAGQKFASQVKGVVFDVLTLLRELNKHKSDY